MIMVTKKYLVPFEEATLIFIINDQTQSFEEAIKIKNI